MFDFAVFLLFTIGVGFIIYSAIKFKPAEKPGTKEQIEEKLAQIEAAVAEADHAMTEISAMSQKIYDEISERYIQLLHLYELIDKKDRKSVV